MRSLFVALTILPAACSTACGDTRVPHDPSMVSCYYAGKSFDAVHEVTSCLGDKQRIRIKGKVPQDNGTEVLTAVDEAGRAMPLDVRVRDVTNSKGSRCTLETFHPDSQTQCISDLGIPETKCKQLGKSSQPLCDMHIVPIVPDGLDRLKK